ncbi:uncharacterized protein LOC110983191 isoform X3 [Acanthaster planci]|uniref:Uncharacterized protein LOC110983191 isoform X3 n=1 Tax=Acanthaster planci TaxID=133434 RepID=A0A8B7YX84_ACAPL|nr:uncharacterized protein LOC110983191 isoform X3 [Acanthaster planci]
MAEEAAHGRLEEEQEEGEDSDVAAYRNLIVEMEREIEEQSPDSSTEYENKGLLKSSHFDMPRLGTPPRPLNGILANSHKGGQGSANASGLVRPACDSPDYGLAGRGSPVRSAHTPPGDPEERLTPTSPRSSSPILIHTPSPVLNRSTSPLCEKKPRRNRKTPVVSDPVIQVKAAAENPPRNGKTRLIDDIDSIERQKAALGEKPEPPKSTVRTFKQRSAQENFGLYGLLTPALCLVPAVDGHDALTRTFSDLCGEHRELKLAAAHIDDAINGRGKWGKARAFFTSRQGQLCFKVINNKSFTVVVLLAAVLHMIMAFLEPPAVQQTSPAVFVLTMVSLLVYTIDVWVNIGFLSWRVFWSLDENKWMRTEFVFLCMFSVDFVMLVIQEIVQVRLLQPFRCLRAVIIMCKLKNVGHIFDTVLSIVINLIKTFFIILIFIIMFSAMGVHLFSESYHCINCNVTDTSNCSDNDTFNIYTGAFDNIGITALRLFVLLSTENYPEFMIPAFNKNSWSFLYFGIFVFVGVFFLTAILLAIIVDSYWEFAKKHVKMERARERAELAKAWNLLDPLGKGSLPVYDEKFIKLFKILKPQNTDEMNMQLISYLDSNQDEVVDSLEWTIRLNEALCFEFEMDEIQDMSTNPKWFNNLKRVVKKLIFSDWFARAVMVFIVAHCILFCLEWRGMSETARLGINIGKSVIIGLFLVEACLRVFSNWRILKEVIEVLDIVFILIALINNILWYFSTEHKQVLDVIGGLAVACRVGLNSAQTKRAVVVFFTKIFPVMFDLIILVFVILFLYSVVGYELFYSQTPNYDYNSGHYDYKCLLGFESLGCSLLMVFQIITTSNWHEIMNSAMVSTTDWACLYFILGFIFINLIVMNLFVAIAIEAFNKLGTEKELAAAQDTDKPAEPEDANFATSAKTFLNNLFESSRAEQGKDKTERTNQNGSPRLRRPSRVSVVGMSGSFSPMPYQTSSQSSLKTPEPQEDEELEEEVEDYSGLTPQERKRRQLKKKMMDKKKKKVSRTKIVVVTAYKGSKDQELDLNVGDEVTILKKQDDWWEGQIKDKKGWFPASHVKEVKRNNVVHFQDQEKADQAADNPKPAWNQDTMGSLDSANSTLPGANDSQRDHLHPVGLSQIASLATAAKHKPRLKVRNTGSWRKEILGDITVMNPEELKALNKILKGQSGRGSLTGSLTLGGNLRKPPSLTNDSVIEEEPDNDVALSKTVPLPKPTPLRAPPPPRAPPPMISLERADTLPLPDLAEIEEEEEEGPTSKPGSASKKEDKYASKTDTLTVEKPEVPASVKKKQNREKAKNGEMPSWMLKFAQDNKLNVLNDVKFDESNMEARPPSSSSDDELQSLPGKVPTDGESEL